MSQPLWPKNISVQYTYISIFCMASRDHTGVLVEEYSSNCKLDRQTGTQGTCDGGKRAQMLFEIVLGWREWRVWHLIMQGAGQHRSAATHGESGEASERLSEHMGEQIVDLLAWQIAKEILGGITDSRYERTSRTEILQGLQVFFWELSERMRKQQVGLALPQVMEEIAEVVHFELIGKQGSGPDC